MLAGWSARQASALGRVARSGPWRQQQHEPRVGLGRDLVALGALEVGQEPRAARLRAAIVGRDLDLALGHEQIRALVHLMVLELLAAREVDGDHPGLGIRAQHLRLVHGHVQRVDLPSLHCVSWSSGAGVAARNYAGTGSASARSVRRAIHSAPAWSVSPWAMIDTRTASDARLKISRPAEMPWLRTSSE